MSKQSKDNYKRLVNKYSGTDLDSADIVRYQDQHKLSTSATGIAGVPFSPTSPTESQVMAYDSVTNHWAPSGIPTSRDATSIRGTTVSTGAPTTSQVLAYDSVTSQYVPSGIVSGAGASPSGLIADGPMTVGRIPLVIDSYTVTNSGTPAISYGVIGQRLDVNGLRIPNPIDGDYPHIYGNDESTGFFLRGANIVDIIIGSSHKVRASSDGFVVGQESNYPLIVTYGIRESTDGLSGTPVKIIENGGLEIWNNSQSSLEKLRCGNVVASGSLQFGDLSTASGATPATLPNIPSAAASGQSVEWIKVIVNGTVGYLPLWR